MNLIPAIKQLCFACALLMSVQLALAKPKEQSAPEDKALAEARQALNSGRPEDCETKLTTILQNTPNDLSARQLHAEVLFQLHRYHFAEDEARKVLQARSEDADTCLLLGKIYQSIHQADKAVDFYNKYLSLVKPSDTTAQYKTLVQVLEDQAKTESTKHAKARAEMGNYLAAVAGSGFMRWKNPQNIRVYIKSGQGVDGYRPEFEEALRQAFDDWTQSTEGKIAFVFLPDQSDAQMIVTWTSDLKAPALKAEAGLAKTSYGADGLDKADILLLTLDPFKEGPIGCNYLFNICLHEIGHALGLQGHSPHPEDIMSPSLYTQQGLSDRDVNTILALYSDKNPAESLPEVDEYGRPLSSKEKCARLVQSGTAAAMAGQYDKAIEKLETALEIDPNNDLARKNLAVAANNLAISAGTAQEKKLTLLRLALFWQADNQAAHGNLESELQQEGIDPHSFSARVSLGDKCAAKNDKKGAYVEYREALAIKQDQTIKTKMNALNAIPEPKMRIIQIHGGR